MSEPTQAFLAGFLVGAWLVWFVARVCLYVVERRERTHRREIDAAFAGMAEDKQR